MSAPASIEDFCAQNRLQHCLSVGCLDKFLFLVLIEIEIERGLIATASSFDLIVRALTHGETEGEDDLPEVAVLAREPHRARHPPIAALPAPVLT